MWLPPMATRTPTLGVSTIVISRWLPVGFVSSRDGEALHLIPQQNHSAPPPQTEVAACGKGGACGIEQLAVISTLISMPV